ncbi:MAG: hypothetical protein AAF334_06330 [Pseudomonadota bacterium]
MILVLSRRTISNPEILRVTTVPRRILGLGLRANPRESVLSALFWRTLFERSLVRYSIALAPFPLTILIRPETALGLSQAPLFMFAVVLIVENYVLTITNPEKRKAIITAAEAERVLDLVRARSMAVLTRIVAGRDINSGTLHLVIEQSELLRVPNLTYISIQQNAPDAGFLDLTEDEVDMLRTSLFDEALTERSLQYANVRANTGVRSFALDARSISAHARLDALAARRREETPSAIA